VDRLYRISVAQYFEMAHTGILTKHDRVVLLEGLLVAKMTKKPPHVLATKLTIDALRASVPAGWHVGQEAPTATLDSVPEPDCTVIRGVARDFRDRWAGPQDVALVVEVADSSLKFDQTVMRIIYARAAIPSTGSSTSPTADWRSTPTRRDRQIRRIIACAGLRP
jgi:hypothetical protein